MNDDPNPLHDKLARLHDLLRRQPRLAVAFSGGVDSVFLLNEAASVLGRDNVLAVTVTGANFASRESGEADAFARQLGVRTARPAWDPFAVPEFAANAPDRCYHCKKALYSLVLAAARDHGIATLADGANASDAADYRPGSRAARELGVLAPLADAGLTKDDIRALLHEKGIPFWKKPAFACLATRVPTGAPVTPEALARIEAAEDFLLGLGFANIRVRHHAGPDGDLARIEVDPDERGRFAEAALWDRIQAGLAGAGYRYVAVDLQGYRKGNMNS